MSISRLPRLYFDGHFSWNPSTFNNDDYASGGLRPWDQFESLPDWSWLQKQTYRGEPVTKANFREWAYDDLFTLYDKDHKPDENQQLAPSEWNLFGGMECGFVTNEFPALQQPDNPDDPGTPVFSKPDGATSVCGFTGTDGVYHQDDGAVGMELQLNVGAHRGPFPASAKLIDIDPTSPLTSQVFADDFRLGDGTRGFSGRVSQRMHSRWLYFAHNMNEDGGLMIAGVASAVMRTGMRHDEIEWGEPTPALERLREASAATKGVLLQMTVFDTRYFNGPYFGQQHDDQYPGMRKIRDLYRQYFRQLAEFDNGLRTEAPAVPCNRAYSRVVGWLGVWDHDDFVTVPSGRLLSQAVLPDQPEGSPQPAPLQPRSVHTVQKNSHTETVPSKQVPFGSAIVERSADFSTVTVDLCSAVPERDSSGVFADFGSVELGIRIDDEYHRLCTVLNSTADFEPRYRRTAGVVDLDVSTFDDIDGAPLTREQFDAHPLALRAWSCTPSSQPPDQWSAEQVVALAENSLVAETNSRGLYVDEPDPDEDGPTTTFEIEVRSYAARPAAQVGLVVAQYGADGLLSGDDRPLELFYRTPSGSWAGIDHDTVVDATSGTVTIGLRAASVPAATGGALPMLYFLPVATEIVSGTALTPEHPLTPLPTEVKVPTGSKADPAPSPPAAFYAAVKVLPSRSAQLQEFEALLATAPHVGEVNQWVFDNVYGTYHLMFPVMDFIGTPQDLQQWRGRILEVTDPAHFDTAAYMPPTRTLTRSQREILVRYDDYLSTVADPDAPLRKRLRKDAGAG